MERYFLKKQKPPVLSRLSHLLILQNLKRIIVIVSKLCIYKSPSIRTLCCISWDHGILSTKKYVLSLTFNIWPFQFAWFSIIYDLELFFIFQRITISCFKPRRAYQRNRGVDKFVICVRTFGVKRPIRRCYCKPGYLKLTGISIWECHRIKIL